MLRIRHDVEACSIEFTPRSINLHSQRSRTPPPLQSIASEFYSWANESMRMRIIISRWLLPSSLLRQQQQQQLRGRRRLRGRRQSSSSSSSSSSDELSRLRVRFGNMENSSLPPSSPQPGTSGGMPGLNLNRLPTNNDDDDDDDNDDSLSWGRPIHNHLDDDSYAADNEDDECDDSPSLFMESKLEEKSADRMCNHCQSSSSSLSSSSSSRVRGQEPCSQSVASTEIIASLTGSASRGNNFVEIFHYPNENVDYDSDGEHHRHQTIMMKYL
ncbi:hypothetical protein KQX54_001585 [Cotesia glomerata]|uniref:Uncharacterized protein n=1 Tax=Cotesia glomerata TaxID=32391 RepID=A0AAV7IWK7_COTGL|nr:hypothetical protein KQX54_001585 [Cotesia glomerata]